MKKINLLMAGFLLALSLNTTTTTLAENGSDSTEPAICSYLRRSGIPAELWPVNCSVTQPGTGPNPNEDAGCLMNPDLCTKDDDSNNDKGGLGGR